MSISSDLKELVDLKDTLVDNLNTIGVETNKDEKYNSLISKLYTKKGAVGELTLPWFNLYNYKGTEARLILDSIHLKNKLINAPYWLAGLEDPTLEIDLKDYIDFESKPDLTRCCLNISCKTLLLEGIDFTFIGSKEPQFIYGSDWIENFIIRDCKFTGPYGYGFMFSVFTQPAGTPLKCKNCIIENVECTEYIGSNGYPQNNYLEALWSGQYLDAESFYLKNVTVHKNANAFRSFCDGKTRIKNIYVDNLRYLNRYDFMLPLDNFLDRALSVEDVTIINCNLYELFDEGSGNVYTAYKNLKEFKMNEGIELGENLGSAYNVLNKYIPYYDSYKGAVPNLRLVDISNWSGKIEKLYMFPRFDGLLDSTSTERIIFKMDNWDISNVKDISYFCRMVGPVENLDTLKTLKGTAYVNNCKYAFGSLTSSKTKNLSVAPIYNEIDISKFDITECTSLQGFFSQDTFNPHLKRIVGTLNCSNINTTYYYYSNRKESYCFQNLEALEELPPLINLGKSIDTSLTRTTCDLYWGSLKSLSHDTILNIFNNLYDLNITYNVANGGTLLSQPISLHANVKAQLTPEEIAIATNKGWTVS